jgi:hypothetical protein
LYIKSIHNFKKAISKEIWAGSKGINGSTDIWHRKVINTFGKYIQVSRN